MHPNRRAVSATAATVVVIVIIVLAAGAVFLVPGVLPKTSSTTTTKHYTMALILGGDESDQGWNMVGLQAAQVVAAKYNLSLAISRDVAFSDQDKVEQDYANKGYNIIWAHGGQFVPSTNNTAKSYPNTFFIQTPAYGHLQSNEVGLGPSFQVTGYYQAGVLAAKMTKTNAIAVIVGAWYDYISEEFYAFKAGAQSVNSNVKVFARDAENWGDPSLGYQLASTLIQTKSVDVIAQIADATGAGVRAAAQQRNVSLIGTVADQTALAPSITLSSVLMNTTAFIDKALSYIVKGTFSQIGGTMLNLNLGSLSSQHPYSASYYIPQAVETLLTQTLQKIQSGAITVPQTVTQNPPADPA